MRKVYGRPALRRRCATLDVGHRLETTAALLAIVAYLVGSARRT